MEEMRKREEKVCKDEQRREGTDRLRTADGKKDTTYG